MSDSKNTSAELATKWNVRYQYSKEQSKPTPEPATLLAEYVDFLPASGDALDLAAGRGGNARLLAANQLNTHAWDISSVAMQELKSDVPSIHAVARDVTENPPEPNSFDVIVVSRFLDRSLCSAIQDALRVDGVLFYQTFTSGLSNPEFMLKPNELLELFSELQVLVYLESVSGSESGLVASRIC